LLQLDTNNLEFIITHTRVEDAVGTKIPLQDLPSGKIESIPFSFL
jgi:hypothetical protein